MVKKLFKHELLAYLHTLPILYIVLLSIGLMGRIVRIFEEDSVSYELLGGSAFAALFIAIFAATVLTTIFCLLRFYKNLFTGEGYLTLTLPVSIESHLFVKTLGALVANVATALAIGITLCLFFAGDWLNEITKAILFIFKEATAACGTVNMIFYIIEALLALLVLTLMQYMTYYVCICLGQALRRGRIIAAIGIYYGLTILAQIISTVFLIAVSINEDSALLIALTNWIQGSPFSFIHCLLCTVIVLGAAWCAVCFFVSRAQMKRRLNLE